MVSLFSHNGPFDINTQIVDNHSYHVELSGMGRRMMVA